MTINDALAVVGGALDAICEPLPPANLPGLPAPSVAQWLRLD